MTTKRIIIIDTFPTDVHALAVKWAIQQKHDAQCHLLFGDDFPSQSRITITQRPTGEVGLCFADNVDELALNGTEPITYWVRRRTGPIIGDEVHPADQRVALREAEAILSSSRLLLAEMPHVETVNPLVGRQRALSKPYQLSVAAAVGMKIPLSMMSNDRAQIIKFLSSVPARGLYKPFCPAFWAYSDEGRGYTALASVVEPNRLPNQSTIQNSPGIFQEYVSKAFEVRLVAMGSTLFATKLDSQLAAHSEIDWRGYVAAVPQTIIAIPDSISQMCFTFMRRIGIVFGCFDFIVDPSGSWTFLECNEQGQWLWQEAVCPQLPLLDAFVEFLIHPSPNFRYTKTPSALGFHSYLASDAYKHRLTEQSRHVQPQPFRSIEPMPESHPPATKRMAK